MPVVNEFQGGLRRYAVFSFVEDTDCRSNKSAARKFPSSPLTSAFEPATRLAHTELFHMKRMKSVERRDIYEELQLVDPKHDMITTPIDASDANDEYIEYHRTKKDDTEEEKRLRGYIVIAYKTMEHMYSRAFVNSWKTWTGVRYICMQLPRQLGLRRIAFYRQLAGTSTFTYILVLEIHNLLLYVGQTLNLLDRIKLRLCGYMGVFREDGFVLDHATAQALNMETEYQGPISMRSATRQLSQASILDQTEDTVSVAPDNLSLGSIDVKVKAKRATGKVQKSAAMKEDDKKEVESKKQSPPSATSESMQEKETQHVPPDSSRKSAAEKKKLRKESKEKQHETVKTKRSIEDSASSAETTQPPTRESSLRGVKDHILETPEDELDGAHKELAPISSIEAEVHPTPFKATSKFVGHGRICQSAVPQMATVDPKRPLISNEDKQSRRGSTASESRRLSLLAQASAGFRPISAGFQAKNERIQYPKPHHNVVLDLPSTREQEQQQQIKQPPQYESIFKRDEHFLEHRATVPDFSTIAAKYNSPIFTRQEWKQSQVKKPSLDLLTSIQPPPSEEDDQVPDVKNSVLPPSPKLMHRKSENAMDLLRTMQYNAEVGSPSSRHFSHGSIQVEGDHEQFASLRHRSSMGNIEEDIALLKSHLSRSWELDSTLVPKRRFLSFNEGEERGVSSLRGPIKKRVPSPKMMLSLKQKKPQPPHKKRVPSPAYRSRNFDGYP